MKPILTYGNPVLRQACQPVTAHSPDVDAIIADMIPHADAMRGVGLAANQIGSLMSIVVINLPIEMDTEHGQRMNPSVSFPWVLLNPVITKFSDDTAPNREGCLSFPGLFMTVVRPTSITVEYCEAGPQLVKKTMDVKGFLSVVVQHEVDHLNGTLFIDRVSIEQRKRVYGQLKDILKQTHAK